MNRLKLLAAAMLLAVPIISACGDEVPPPPPTGSINGLVSIEGQGVDAVSVTLSNGASATTANGGMFRFDGVEAGAYTVTISNYPADASFDQTSEAATIATDGETVTINFPGTYIRTSSVMGTVTVENEGLSGVTVKLSGTGESETLTDGNGQYAFTGLRAGNYTIAISGFDDEDVSFGSPSSAATVAVGESKVVSFEGTFLRTAAITGQVSVEGNPLSGVTVSLQGRGEDETATTNGAGQFTFSELRSGDYAVGITNPDEDQYSFEVTSRTVTVAHGETATVPFDGTLLRTAGVMGTVTVEGTGLPGVTVTINGQGEEHDAVTNVAGQYSFADLHAGEYTIGITGYDDDEYEFDATSQTVTVELQVTKTVAFDGIMLRTAGIEGTVTVEGHALPGVTVTISGGPRGEEHTRTTNDAGYYMVDRLHAGDYAVAISNFDANEYEFPSGTTTTITVALRSTATVAFQGDLLRTAGISGRVSVGTPATGLDGIMVTLSGDADATDMTKDGGQYAFTGLAEGDYTVTMSGHDEAAYSFDMTEADVPVGDGAAVVQNFNGMHTMTASVSGMLFLDEVDGDGMHTDGEPAFAYPAVPLLLQGPGVSDVKPGMSMEDGSYAFDGLRAGPYRVLINMTDTVAAALTAGGFRYSGEATGTGVSVDAAMAATVNFPFRIVMQTIFAGAVMGNATTATEIPVAGVSMAMYPTAEDADDGTNVLGSATTSEMGVAQFDFARAMDLGPGGQGTDNLVFVKVTGVAIPGLVVSDNANIEVEYEATDRVSQAPTAVRLLNTIANFQWEVKSNETARDGNELLEDWTAMGVATGVDGKATFTGAANVADLPMTFTVELDTLDQPDMGEVWSASGTLEHVHTGFEHPAMNGAEMNDLGPIFVTYTTQSLVLGVYREADDVEGFSDYRSGLARGDHRPAPGVGNDMTVELLVRDSRGRLRTLEYDHDFNDTTEMIDAKGDFGADGMKTFTHIPAGEEITVRFRVGADRVLVSDYSDIEAFGEDLDLGATVGTFGEMSGGMPEVRLCSASRDSSDEWCATYGYQWTTGMVSGYVGYESDHAVMVEPTTGHGATGDSTGTVSNEDVDDGQGNYVIRGLQDGEYTATAISGSEDYSIVVTPADPLNKRVVVYHDEFEDDEDTLTTFEGMRGSDLADWNTRLQGLAVRGYIANDYSDDDVVRGHEAVEGVTVKLLANVETSLTTGRLISATTVATTTTNGRGFYSFDDLQAGSYWVQAGSGSDYKAYRGLGTRYPNPNLSGGVSADAYPELPTEGSYDIPQWNPATNSATGTSVTITDDKGTSDPDDDVSATLHNFALVYSNGTVAGVVSNMSGSNGGIDVRVYSDVDDSETEVSTASSGGFELAGVLEGNYSAQLDDIGYESPCMDGTTPDDDAPDADDGSGVCARAATTLTGTVDGRNDYESMGTLYVYSTRASALDSLTANPLVKFRMEGDSEATYNDADSADAGWTRGAQDAGTTANTTSLGTISWESESVTFAFPRGSIPLGSRVVLEAAVGECAGATCELGYFETGGDENTGDATARADTITVTVTAENGYDDHVYSVMVSRANPEDNQLGAASEGRVRRHNTSNNAYDNATAGDGTFGAPYTLATEAGETSLRLHVNLKDLGVLDDNAACAQTLIVRNNAGEEVGASGDDDDDICTAERYRLAVAESGSRYTLRVSSEDGVEAVHHLALTMTPDPGEDE